MNKTKQPDALALARIHANGLRERSSEVSALLCGALALLDCGDAFNSGEVLQIALDMGSDTGMFKDLEKALDELGAHHG